jgi:hypothetical protein
MNRQQRLREVARVCLRADVERWPAPPDWGEWGYCPDCAAATGQPCYDVLGSTRAMRTTDRMGPHPARVPAGGEPA